MENATDGNFTDDGDYTFVTDAPTPTPSTTPVGDGGVGGADLVYVAAGSAVGGALLLCIVVLCVLNQRRAAREGGGGGFSLGFGRRGGSSAKRQREKAEADHRRRLAQVDAVDRLDDRLPMIMEAGAAPKGPEPQVRSGVFISFVVQEALQEAKKLQSVLLIEYGVEAVINYYMTDSNVEWATEVATKIRACRVFVALGTPEYGQKLPDMKGTWDELGLARGERKPVFMIKMCQNPETLKPPESFTSVMSGSETTGASRLSQLDPLWSAEWDTGKGGGSSDIPPKAPAKRMVARIAQMAMSPWAGKSDPRAGGGARPGSARGARPGSAGRPGSARSRGQAPNPEDQDWKTWVGQGIAPPSALGS